MKSRLNQCQSKIVFKTSGTKPKSERLSSAGMCMNSRLNQFWQVDTV